ncbi:MAG: IBR domain-containing protein [Chloroflexota bacterium]
MPTTEVARTPNSYLQTPRVIKCPTPQCPGWITLDSTRQQTEPCRYCRISVDTLRFLLSRVGADNKVLSPEVHDEFNRLMLTMAGAWGQNVYLRPSDETLVDLKAGARGVTVEYNPYLGDAGSDGAAPLVGVILHKLLHFEAHLGQRAPQLVVKSGSREKEGLAPMMTYLMTVADHAWVTARLGQLNPILHSAQSRWGLDLAQMLVGSESMFNRYLSERNLLKLLDVLKETESAEAFRESVLDRLATLTAQILYSEKEDARRTYLAVQLANTHILNPDAYDAYVEALHHKEVANLRDAQPLAEKLYHEFDGSPISHPQAPKQKARETAPTITLDNAAFLRALEGSIKALGMANYFEVKG